jgi:hypothetical protein
MNAFDLNRKEYIRVNNNNDFPLTQFNKVTFLTSVIVAGRSADPLPLSNDYTAAKNANELLIENVNLFCTFYYNQTDGYACYITEINLVNNTVDVNVPYAKVNIYAMDGRDL